MPGARRRDAVRTSAPALPAAGGQGAIPHTSGHNGSHRHPHLNPDERARSASLDLYVLHIRPTTAPPFLRAYGPPSDAPYWPDLASSGSETPCRTITTPPAASLQRPQSRTRPAPASTPSAGVPSPMVARPTGRPTAGHKNREPAGSSGSHSSGSVSNSVGASCSSSPPGCGARKSGFPHAPLAASLSTTPRWDAPPSAFRLQPSPDPLAAPPRPRPSALAIPDVPPPDPPTPHSTRPNSFDSLAGPAAASIGSSSTTPAAGASNSSTPSGPVLVGHPRPSAGPGPAAALAPSPRTAAIRYVNDLISDVLAGMQAQRGVGGGSSRAGSARCPDTGYSSSSRSGGGGSSSSSGRRRTSAGPFGREAEPMGGGLSPNQGWKAAWSWGSSAEGTRPGVDMAVRYGGGGGSSGIGGGGIGGGGGGGGAGEDGVATGTPGAAGRWLAGNRCTAWRADSGRAWPAVTTSAATATATATAGTAAAMATTPGSRPGTTCGAGARHGTPAAAVATPTTPARRGGAALGTAVRRLTPEDWGQVVGSGGGGGDASYDGHSGLLCDELSDLASVEHEGAVAAGGQGSQYDGDGGGGGGHPARSSSSSSFLDSLVELHSVAAAAVAGRGGGGSVAAMVERLLGYDSLGASKKILEARECIRSGRQQQAGSCLPAVWGHLPLFAVVVIATVAGVARPCYAHPPRAFKHFSSALGTFHHSTACWGDQPTRLSAGIASQRCTRVYAGHPSF